MKKLLIILAVILLSRCLVQPAFAQVSPLPCASGFIEIFENGTFIDSATGLPYEGQLTLTQTYNASAGTSTIRGDQQMITVTGGLFHRCVAPGWFRVRQLAANSALPITSQLQIPTTGGPYRFTDVPTATVNTSGTAVSWLSGITFASMAVGDTAISGSGSCKIASIQSSTALTCTVSQGTQSGITFSDGAIEQQSITPIPATISGPTGPAGAPGATGATGPQGPAGTAPSGTPNKVVATDPSGSATSPAALRSLVVADIPTSTAGAPNSIPKTDNSGNITASAAIVSGLDALLHGLTAGTGSVNPATSSNSSGISTVFGYGTGLHGMTDAYPNAFTAFGYEAMGASGGTGTIVNSENVAIGYKALWSNTAGINNALGATAMYATTTGSTNSAFGLCSLCFNTTGSGNTAIGYHTLIRNSLGSSSVAIGASTMTKATTALATFGTLIGGSGYVNGTYTSIELSYLSGTPTVVVEGQSQHYPTVDITVSGGSVTSVVVNSSAATNYGFGFQDTTTVMTTANSSLGGTGSGFSIQAGTLATGQQNTAVGAGALSNITTGSFNTAVGNSAGGSATTGSYNTWLGARNSISVSGGSNNTFIGGSAIATGITTGSYNTILGGNVTGLSPTLNNQVILSDGNGDVVFTCNGLTFICTTPGSINGVSPTTMAFVDPTSSIQTQLNGKQAALGFTPLNPANSLSDVASVAAAKTNLGLAAVATSGSASDVVTGTLPNARISALPNANLAFSTVSFSFPSWLSGSGATALGGTQTVSAATGQSSHQVIGTCGAATSFAPCSLVAADVPTLNQNTSGTAVNLSGLTADSTFTQGNGSGGVQSSGKAIPAGVVVGTSDTQALTSKTVDGVTPATMAFVDPTSSIQTQLNGKAASNASTTVNGQTCTLSSTCTISLSAVNAQTATYQVLAADFSAYKTITVASGTFTITLVASGSQPAAGQYIRVINYGSGVVTVARSGQNINGGTASLTLPASTATAPSTIFVQSDGTNYFAAIAGGSGGGATLASMYTQQGANYFYPLFQSTGLPDAPTWTWLYQPTGATVNAAGTHAVTLYTPGSASSTLAARKDGAALTSSTFTLQATLMGSQFMINNPTDLMSTGICVTDGTKVVSFGFKSYFGSVAVGTEHWTNATTVAHSAQTFIGFPWMMWLKITLSSSTLNFFYSMDGTNFIIVGTEGVSSFLAAGTLYGCTAANSANATYPVGTTLVDWSH